MSETEKDNIKPTQQPENTTSVLVVDDDPALVRFMLETLARRAIRADLANDQKTAVDFLDKNTYDLVFTSDRLSQRASLSSNPNGGFELLEKIKANSPELPVIMMTQDRKQNTKCELIDTAVRAIRQGCRDFLVKPIDRGKIESLLDTFLPNHRVSTLASAEESAKSLYKIVGKSPKLIQTIELAKRVAPTSVPVLISGESGTGKELVSYFIHHNSRRSQGPYIRVNCAALCDSLLESELFGHERGAFTGAYAQRKGRFEMAHGGTLLLDEITETPPKFQAKLLRVLEQQGFERVGGEKQVKVDVRIISTTNKDLLQEVQANRFRQDLYYRLSTVRLFVSPLRQRTEDLPELIWYFADLHAHQVQRQITDLDPAMMNIFAKYHWPGNVRQLRNVVLTSLILGVGRTLSLADVSWLFDELQPLPEVADGRLSVDDGLGGIPLVQVEQQAILDTLQQTEGNQTKAAKVLGISDRTLRDKIKRYRKEGCLVGGM